ncbi:MAG TPA: DUF3300 domain-containing protein [Vicinamibacterales bacterium]
MTSSRPLVAVLCTALIWQPALWPLYAEQAATKAAPQPAAPQPAAQKIPADQLDSLVAPIALYPDPMMAQVLAASTYPLEIIQLQQWLEKNPSLKDKPLADAVKKQPWDPSVQALAGLPDLVKRLADDIQWTADLGNAFLAQQSDVMDAIQRMRKKAQDKGTLKSTEQAKVETQVVEKKQVIVIEQTNPQVVYVPTYNPVVVYGPPVYAYYPYPPIYYPPPSYYAAGVAIAWGVGFAMGAFWGGGGWGYHAGWGHNDIDINVNNNFNRNTNINGGNRNQVNPNRGGAGNKWQHNPQHRGGTPYSDRSTANKYGGNARGDSLSSRQGGAQQQLNRQGGNVQSGNRTGSGAGTRPSTTGANRSGSSAGTRPSTSGAANRPAGGADRVGGRDMSSAGTSRNAMGSGNRSTYSGSRANSSSSRGASSMGSRGGGGGRRR